MPNSYTDFIKSDCLERCMCVGETDRETDGQMHCRVMLMPEALVLPLAEHAPSRCDSACGHDSTAPTPACGCPPTPPEHHLTEPPFCQVSRLSLELGDHLQDPGSRLFPATPLLMEPFKMEMKKSETPEMPPTWEEESAGVEDVRSQTYSKERLERLPPAEPKLGGFGKFQTWVPGPSQEDARLAAGARERPGEGLRLEVRPSQEEQGYIVTGNE